MRFVHAVAVALLVLPMAAMAEERLYVQVPAVIDPNAKMSTGAKEECPVAEEMGNNVLAAVKRRFPGAQAAQTIEQAGTDKFVALTITHMRAPAGGSFSGPKTISIRVDLQQGGKTLRSTKLTRSGGGFWSHVVPTTTCWMVEHVTQAMGNTVTKWLRDGQAPSSNEPDELPAAPAKATGSVPASDAPASAP